VECEWENDAEADRRAHLTLMIRQYDDRLFRDGVDAALRDYEASKELSVHQIDFDPEVTDLPGLGSDAYAIMSGAHDTVEGEVQVECIVGSTVIQVSYAASPSNATLRLAAAGSVVTAMVEGLR
jgi:hypothetical protein